MLVYLGRGWGGMGGAELVPSKSSNAPSPHVPVPSSLQAANSWLSLNTSMGFLGPGFLVPRSEGLGAMPAGTPITDRPPPKNPPKPTLRPHTTHFMPLWAAPHHQGILFAPPWFEFLGVMPSTRSSPPFFSRGGRSRGRAPGLGRCRHRAGVPGGCHRHGNLLAAE